MSELRDIVHRFLQEAFPEADISVSTYGGNNFNISVKSSAFNQMAKIAQHKLVYKALVESEVSFHAVQISTSPSY